MISGSISWLWPSLEFIDSIPCNETRKYVKNVLRNYVIYKSLYDNKSFKRFEDILPIRNGSFFILHGHIK